MGRIVSGNHASAGKRKTGKTRKGNHAIRYLLCEAANAARRTKSALREKYQSLVARRGRKKAVIAVAHQIIRTIFYLFTRRQRIGILGSTTKRPWWRGTRRAGLGR